MVEALDQSCTRESLRYELRRRLSAQFLRGHAIGIGHIDDALPLPGGQRVRDIEVRLETNCPKDDVRFDCLRQILGNDRGPNRAASTAKLSGSRVVATDTAMPLRANALARALPMLPKPIVA